MKQEFKYTENKGLIYIDSDKMEKEAILQPCFPWSNKNNYYSIKDMEGEELMLIDDLGEFSEESKKAIGFALVESGFCFNICEVLSVNDEFELRMWEVNTDSGVRKFQTKLTDWPISVPSGGLLIQDLFGDQYYIKDTDSLDEKSKKLLWSFL